ncbi:hypothetical protein KAU11_08020 [Candidatus Babeliales bacterium]|nr:hypothetical protein [Candidatus Babeliales bacterium]
MDTLKNIKGAENSLVRQSLISLLQDAEEALGNWFQVRHMDTEYKLGGDTDIMNTRILLEAEQVAELRSLLGLCSYVQELETEGKAVRTLDTRLPEMLY